MRTVKFILFLFLINISSSIFAQLDRPYIRESITKHGQCRNVALTETNGDLMLYGDNGYACTGCPPELISQLRNLNSRQEVIQDVQLTELGEWLILHGNNGLNWSNIPYQLEQKLRDYNSNREKITSVTFNDGGDWIVITTEHYSASETWILDWLHEGAEKYGMLWTVCITHKAMVAVYEEGYKYYGEVPSTLKDALRTTRLDVYRLKIAGESWFFADEEGRYQYLFGDISGTNVDAAFAWSPDDYNSRGGNSTYSDYDDGYSYGYGSDFQMTGSGSGFAVSSDGYIATCEHVINGARRVQVRGINGDFSTAYKAEVVASDRVNDIAIIRITDKRFTSLDAIPYSINLNPADIGESVFVLGYPLRAIMGDEIKLTNGVISSTTGFQGNETTYQVSATVQAGNSGGPLFDEDGNIIGVISSRLTDIESASYAVKTSYLKNLMNRNNISIPNKSSLSGLKLSNQVKEAKRFVYIIETESR